LQGKLCKRKVSGAYGNSNLELWHKRLGHMSKRGLQILAQKILLSNIKGKSLEAFTDYLASK